MSDLTIFIIGTAVFGIALMGTMWSIIPAERQTNSVTRAKLHECEAVET